MTAHPTLSVVIPTLNAETALADTIQSVQDFSPEIVVVDGGSTDDTMVIAEKFGAKIFASEKGRGRQLRAGGEAATGDWLLFLHADTRLTEGWGGEAFAFMTDPDNTERAAVFACWLDDPAPQARRVERLVAWRTRYLGLPFGDQGLLLTRTIVEITLFGRQPLRGIVRGGEERKESVVVDLRNGVEFVVVATCARQCQAKCAG